MIGENGMERLKRELAKIKASEVKKSEALVTWKAIAFEMGLSRSTLIRWCEANGIQLPHYGPAKKARVFLPKGRLMILKELYFA